MTIPTLLLLAALSTSALAQDESQPAVDPDQLADLVDDWGEPSTDEPRRPQRPGARRNQNTTTTARPEPTVSFGVFSEPIELTTLIDYVGNALNINIVVKGTPTGEIVFNAPVEVPKSKLIDLLDAMLEQFNYTVTNDSVTGFWVVQPITDLKPNPGAERASMRIIPTPNIKPSLIVPALSAALGSGFGGSPGQSGGSSALQAIDELGVIIINAPARDISRIETLVADLLTIDNNQRYIRFELDHLAAPVARDRAVGLAGGSSASLNSRANQFNPQGGQQGGTSISGGSLSNIGDRLAIDPQGNALIFKGTEQEISRVEALLKVIDVPNTLEPKSYFAGSSAAQIADIAARRGLGEVIQISNDSTNTQNPFGGFRANQFNNQQLNNSTSSVDTTGGPVMVVDTSRGNIIYYGTATQQKQLADLMDELGTEDERVVIREVVLDHSDADTVAELMTAIITGEQRTGDSDFLPGSSGTRSNAAQNFNPFFQGQGGTAGSDVNAAFDPDLVSITSDPDNNQVVVKAPIKQQDELARLIKRLDRRKPQVYIQAMIVSVEDSENFRLAIESQISAGDFQSQTNFGLSSAGADFQAQRSVATGLAGLTQAVVLSNQIPLILNATQTDTDIRILSTPQLLVNDNQESEIVSIREEPFTEISQADNAGNNLVGFGGFEEAGTTLRVTPSISDGGFMRLEYFVELSNFTSASGIDGSPPPRNTNTLTGNATIPSDGTIIIGGITVENVRDTVIKVPLLGDIPLIGLLFRDTSKITTNSKIYVFLTPRIMTDPNFQDLRLLSEGPYAEMDLDPEVPDLQPAVIGSTAISRDDIPTLPEAPSRSETETSSNEAPALTPAIIAPSDTE